MWWTWLALGWTATAGMSAPVLGRALRIADERDRERRERREHREHRDPRLRRQGRSELHLTWTSADHS